MNETGFSDDDNATFAGNESSNKTALLHGTPAVGISVYYVIVYVSLALGVPGNILSAIVWLRRHVASENPSATHLAALAINDLVFLIFDILQMNVVNRWLRQCALYVAWSTAILEALLVLSFSVLRLIAIRRPLQVCFVRFTSTGNCYRAVSIQIPLSHKQLVNNSLRSCCHCSPYNAATVTVKCTKRRRVISVTKQLATVSLN